MTTRKHALWIPGWHPATLNSLICGHWAKGARRKRTDREMVAAYAKISGVPTASGARRVSLHLVMPPGQRRPDRDAYWKSLLDALVHAGLLHDDSPLWCLVGPVTYSRGEGPDVWGTLVLMEDV